MQNEKVPETSASLLAEGWRHVAYHDEGQFHWVSGIAPRDCELYQRVDPPATPLGRTDMQDNVTQAVEDQRLADFLLKEGGEIAHDMAHHVGDQIFEVMKRNGMAQRSEAGATAMLTIASTMLLEQAIDQCSRAAEDDCRGAVVRMFRAQLSSETCDAIDDAGIDVSDIRERTDFTGGEVGKYACLASTAQPEVKGLVEAAFLEGYAMTGPARLANHAWEESEARAAAYREALP